MIVNKPLPQPNSTGNPNVVSIDIYSIDESLDTILANCMSEDGSCISESNWFWYKGDNKNVPFTLTKTEIAKIKSVE